MKADSDPINLPQEADSFCILLSPKVAVSSLKADSDPINLA